ncbi:TniQ family protein [Yersinia enterocolitica]|nr:TniQ family protein [Yersinia enterocolitica]EKN3994448.1 TniQ family protein [Yersinia enterocolitica]EKN5083420.1 hypothetical protein [Yersinia enterocolitica]EKN6400330.1 hypothetical protein [Yersinia enterocolitica]EKP3833020.1 TniQ family protein [Yersinia enterocolitica]
MWSVVSECPGESLSSWLVRVALDAGCDPLSLAHAIWPGWRAWTHDVDRALTRQQLSVLERHSGLDEVSLHSMTLAGLLGNSVGQPLVPLNGVLTGVIPLGICNRSCPGGVQFCPLCLSDDHRPYFRLTWRLAYSMSCLRHQCLLNMRCPRCGEPVQYHRLKAPDERIYLCFRCLADLRESVPEPAGLQVMAFQKTALSSLAHRNDVDQCGRRITDDWQAMVYFCIRLIRYAARRHDGALNELLRYSGITVRSDMAGPLALPVEYLPVHERAGLFTAAWHLLQNGPEQFAILARKYGLTFNGLSAFCPPDCLLPLLKDLPFHPVPHTEKQIVTSDGARSRRRVEHRWACLMRRIGVAGNG